MVLLSVSAASRMDSWFEMYHINNNNCFSGGICSLSLTLLEVKCGAIVRLLVDMVVKMFCENAHAYIKAKSNGNSPVGLSLKMEYFIQELMNDNGTMLYFIKRNVCKINWLLLAWTPGLKCTILTITIVFLVGFVLYH
jgi:hypothetical protein